LETKILRKLVATTTAIYEANSREDLFTAMHAGCIDLGFEGFNLSCRPQNRVDVIVNATLTTYSDDYRHDYDRLGWVDSDTVVERALQAPSTFFFKNIAEQYADPRRRGFVDFAVAAGVRSGVATTLDRNGRPIGYLSLLSSQAEFETPEVIHAAKGLAEFAMAKAERMGLSQIVSADEAIARTVLSQVQWDVLAWVAAGKSNGDIATILDMSERAVRHHVSEILRKLGLVSRNQAATLFRSGALRP